MIVMHIGFDDTDSPKTGCTTYIAALIAERLRSMGVSFIDYPNLIRLNPNAPWKTRGNGALCLRILCRKELVEKIKEYTINIIQGNADLSCAETNPGVVFLCGDIPEDLRVFAKKTIQGMVKMKDALRLVKSIGVEATSFKNGRGIIGALAAIGETLEGDHTYEIIAYRYPNSLNTPRRIQKSSVKKMNQETSPFTFNNIDPDTDRILITPRGPDPILYGIRGESAEIVKHAHEIIQPEEPIERWVIFRTNHGTDAHLRRVSSVRSIQPFNPVIVKGKLVRDPRVIPGGHVIFSIGDTEGEIDCAAYEPTGSLRKTAKRLISGDVIEACGGVRPASSTHPTTINLEKIRVLSLAPKIFFSNPKCPECGKRMTSMGKEKGFRCDKCGFRSSKLEKTAVREERILEPGLYVTSQRSQRHLSKPLIRYGREKVGTQVKMIPGWQSR